MIAGTNCTLVIMNKTQPDCNGNRDGGRICAVEIFMVTLYESTEIDLGRENQLDSSLDCRLKKAAVLEEMQVELKLVVWCLEDVL